MLGYQPTPLTCCCEAICSPLPCGSPWLTWGGNEEGKEFVSGVGNFGNAMCFENVEKSILTAGFMSPGHMIKTNKGAFDTLATEMASYAVEPSWRNLTCLMGGAIMGGFRRKDF
ncbi:hypothetical protein [Ruegeria atlantica]|uniref:hypothetical protein n=1 Tax=Ruegeria atlantica TaxID=81569 RepID=UPI001C2C8B1A|nr:hypothetical protein [Ruegeria atlantica]